MVCLSRQVQRDFKGESVNFGIFLWCDVGGWGLNRIKNQ